MFLAGLKLRLLAKILVNLGFGGFDGGLVGIHDVEILVWIAIG